MRTRIMGWALAGVMLLAVMNFPTAQAGEPAMGAEEDLGYPIATQVLSPESSLGVDEEGNILAFYVTNGNEEVSGMLQVVDVERGVPVFQQRLPAGINFWATTFSSVEGRVYFASTDGHLYYWKPGDAEVTSLGIPFPGEGIWRLVVAPDGTIYGGTYPGGLLFSIDATGQLMSHGQVIEGETYVRSIAADDDYVYVGSQPNARLIRWDRVTGATTELPMPADVSGQSAMYDLTLAGDYLFARVEPLNTLIVYNRDDLSVANTVPRITGRVISPADPTGQFVYFRLNNGVDPVGIYEYNLMDHSMRNIGWNPNAFPGAFAFHQFEDQTRFPGYTLVMTFYRGRTYAFNMETRQGLYIGETVLEATPNPIQTVGAGPDGNIYVPGFLSPPGIAQFNPDNDTTTLLAGAGQVEGVGQFDELLLLGRYPNAQLTAYDTTRPWAYFTNPPAPFEIGQEQDRPQSFARVGDEVAVSSVPKSGRLGGAITMWNPRTGDLTVYRDVVEQQSPVSLESRDGLVYAGTAINGGYGVDPIATEAKLVIFNPSDGTVEFETVPLAGAMTVSGLEFDSQGMLWGIADGALFKFNPVIREVVRIEQVFPRSRTMYGTTSEIEFGQDGYLYATSAGALWRVDTTTWERIRLAHAGVRYLAQDDVGNLYFARVAKLYRWNFDLARTIDGIAPATEAIVANDGATAGKVSVTLLAADEGGAGVLSTQYRIDAGPWTTYGEPITFTSAGDYTISYRSIDRDQNVEGAKSVEVTVSEVPLAYAELTPTEPDGLSNWYVTSPTLRLTSDAASIEYRIAHGAWAAYEAPASLPDGDYTVEIRGVAGDFHGDAETIKVQVDTVAPTVSADVDDHRVVSIAAADATSGVSRVEYATPNGKWMTYTAPFEIGNQGRNWYQIRATDVAGNVSDTHTLEVPPAN